MKPNELYINRIYDAPVKVAWDAWVEPDQVAKWCGGQEALHLPRTIKMLEPVDHGIISCMDLME